MLIDQTIGAHHAQFGLGWDAAWTWVSGEAAVSVAAADYTLTLTMDRSHALELVMDRSHSLTLKMDRSVELTLTK